MRSILANVCIVTNDNIATKLQKKIKNKDYGLHFFVFSVVFPIFCRKLGNDTIGNIDEFDWWGLFFVS